MDGQRHLSTDPHSAPPPEWRAGVEPIDGYHLIEPLGRGGFGEVWKCEAPGGMFKAIKAVNGNDGNGQLALQEREALDRVRLLRHPFILSLEQVKEIGGVLIIIMELADKNLQVHHAEARARGQAGIPRVELLELLMEAAEALDWMNFEHGLQHLDIKPQNLFLVSNHLKVADFGLVHTILEKNGPSPYRNGGATPLYAPPEILRGNVSRNSDQYSLAIVFQQMLTGSVPFFSHDAHHLMMQHLTAEPDVSGLPPKDRAIIARALAKDPDHRFASCLELLQQLDENSERRVTRAVRLRKEGSKPELPMDTTRVVNELAQAAAQEYPVSASRLLTPDGARLQSGQDREASVCGSRFIPPGFEVRPLSIPGLKLEKCLGQNALGEYWLARDAENREFRALCLHQSLGTDEKLFNRLRAILHPALPPCRTIRTSSERIALVNYFYQGSLRDRFEACRAAGLPGIPRAELLGYLRGAAAALDVLHGHWHVPHLGLNPRNFLLENGRAWLADYGLVQLLCLQGGQSAAVVNPRFAAPELTAGIPGPAADQFSLALIYAEMLSGYHPQSVRRSSKSGPIRRSGLVRSSEAASVSGKIDLDMVVASDRPILARALHRDPGQRFPSCASLVTALETAIHDHVQLELSNAVPRVITVAELMNEEPPLGLVVPGIGQLLGDMANRADFRVLAGGTQNARYFFHREGFWEYTCPMQVFPNGVRLKLDGFRQFWGARTVHQTDWLAVFQMELPPAAGAFRRDERPVVVEVRVQVQPLQGKTTGMTEARISVRPVWERGPKVAHDLERLGPKIFDSIRSYLQVNPEQRYEQRYPFSHAVRIFPLRDGTDIGDPLEGISRDVSRCGVCFQTSAPPSTNQVYLNWNKIGRLAPFALLARVIRTQKIRGGEFENGAIFHGGLL